jgi:hypothetical protein
MIALARLVRRTLPRLEPPPLLALGSGIFWRARL